MATKTGKKYIICDVAPANRGKTTFLKEVIKVLTIHLGAGLVIATHWRIDQCVVFTHKKSGKTILVQTGGDKEVSFVHTIKYLKTHEVDIILCARIVQDIANKYNYEELDFTHMYPQNFNWSSPAVGISNSILSQAIYDILMSL